MSLELCKGFVLVKRVRQREISGSFALRGQLLKFSFFLVPQTACLLSSFPPHRPYAASSYFLPPIPRLLPAGNPFASAIRLFATFSP